MGKLTTERLVGIGVGIGVVLIWIATLVGTFGEGTTARESLTVLKNTGLALISGILISGGVTLKEEERAVRAAMVVMGVIAMLSLFSSVRMLGPAGLL